jgi:UDP-N-acetylmuramate: L-alanyl-gamma-D-glutamyl-meso-diaminopimelate ligase
MHNIAMALKEQGHEVSGSDDEIYDPSRSRLARVGLLPKEMGWHPQRLGAHIDFCILGMHAKAGNPEIQEARLLGIPVYSFPEFIARHAENKERVVVAGSHGKTTTTAMIMHVLRANDYEFDFLVGGEVEGFRHTVRLSEAPLMVIEGDEYLSSALDDRPKFIHYQPSITVITGIAWDHINVFPTYESYEKAFSDYLDQIEDGAEVYYYEPDEVLTKLIDEGPDSLAAVGYSALPYWVNADTGALSFELGDYTYAAQVQGVHNMQNMSAAAHVCQSLGLEDEQIGSALATFSTPGKRLEVLGLAPDRRVIRDFAHAPSKVKTTLASILEQYPNESWAVVAELHTYSSLNKEFLPQYADALNGAQLAMVFYSPKTLEIKEMDPMSRADIRRGFQRDDLETGTRLSDLKEFLQEAKQMGCSLLLMSSGTFGGADLEELATDYLGAQHGGKNK